jgi:hypothetical protein
MRQKAEAMRDRRARSAMLVIAEQYLGLAEWAAAKVRSAEKP